MVVKEEKLNSIIGIDKDTTLSMKIDDKNQKKLMAILSQNLYQDPIGSIVREYVSNALDAQREANNTDPIKVQLLRENGSFVFKVIDNGVGLSPDRVENVFSKYLSSTKEGDANQLGYYGLGSKSALSYVDSFMIHSRYNGTLYSYMMLKGEQGTELSLLDMNDTTDHNGVTICINLHNDTDYVTFMDKIQRQLCYFEGVYVEDEYQDFDNDYKIIKNEDWKYSEMNQDAYMHLCLDNVYYPLDFKSLGIEPISMPIGLNFSLKDGIMPVPSRESFLYSPATKELILDRIKKVGIYFINKWNEFIPSIGSLEEANRFKNNYGEVLIYEDYDIVSDERKQIKIKIDKKLQKICGVDMGGVVLSLFPNLSVENLKSIEHYFLNEYKIFGKLEYQNFKTKFGNKHNPKEFDDLYVPNLESTCYLLQPGESLSKTQIDYLKWLNRACYIVRKHSTTKLGKRSRYGTYENNTYINLLKLEKKPKTEWRNLIKEYQSFIKTYTDKLLTIADITPSQEYLTWKESQIKTRKTVIRTSKEEISYSTIRYASRGHSIFLPNTKKTIKICDLKNQKGIFIYVHENDVDSHVDLFNFLRNFNYLTMVMLSENNYKKIEKTEKIHNWIKIEDFWNIKNRKISEVLTGYLINTIWDDSCDSASINQNAAIVDKNFVKEFKVLKELRYSGFGNVSEKFIIEKIRLYYKNNWLNMNSIELFKKLCADLHRFDFLDMFNFYYHKDKTLINSFARTIYIKLCKQEKLTGIYNYKRYDINPMILDFVKEPTVIVEIPETVEQTDNIEDLVEIESEIGDII